MKSLFYDDECSKDKSDPLFDEPEFIAVARMYCLNYENLTDEDIQKLSQFLKDLPTGLNVSNEEPWGMQVYGVVKESDWLAWHSTFQEKARQLPHYEIEMQDAAFQSENKDRPRVWSVREDKS